MSARRRFARFTDNELWLVAEALNARLHEMTNGLHENDGTDEDFLTDKAMHDDAVREMRRRGFTDRHIAFMEDLAWN